MPIRPENKPLYPDDWPAIRAAVRRRSGDRCEKCRIPNHSIGYRDPAGNFHHAIDEVEADGHTHLFRIVLTVAHLDHDPTNNDLDNLAHLCQQCHNRHDAKTRAAGIRRRRLDEVEKAGQETLNL